MHWAQCMLRATNVYWRSVLRWWYDGSWGRHARGVDVAGLVFSRVATGHGVHFSCLGLCVRTDDKVGSVGGVHRDWGVAVGREVAETMCVVGSMVA